MLKAINYCNVSKLYIYFKAFKILLKKQEFTSVYEIND